jgi:uncharacterized membrane protein YdbT with pleckstrin-like domain
MDPEPGERVFFHGHPSWRSILDFYLKGLLVAVVGGVIAGLVTRVSSHHVKVAVVAVVVVVILAIMLVLGLIKRIQTTYTISSRRLTINSGILRRELHETRLERVQNVNSIQSVIERLLRIGTVDFDTAAGAEFDFKFRGVADPAEIVRTVDRAIHDQQTGEQSAGDPGSAPGAVGSPPGDSV